MNIIEVVHNWWKGDGKSSIGHGLLCVLTILVGRFGLSWIGFLPGPPVIFATGIGYGVGVGFYLRREILDALRYWRQWRNEKIRFLEMLKGWGDGVVDLMFPIVFGGIAAMLVT